MVRELFSIDSNIYIDYMVDNQSSDNEMSNNPILSINKFNYLSTQVMVS